MQMPQTNRSFITAVDEIVARTRELYLSDSLPWVVGYSGGKDSTASLQIVWTALQSIRPEERTKPVHVISTDTLVENPIVAEWVGHSLQRMEAAAQEQGLPVRTHRLMPTLRNRFWVNLIGKGYPAPRPKFRWCTSRLKINASNDFINEVVSKYGEAILVLGSRRPESRARAKVLDQYEAGSTRANLSRNKELDRVWVYTPIVEWSNDEVWEFIATMENPWGVSNGQLTNMYRSGTDGGECPLVVDSSTPSCGDSRFGCYVCTLVDKDKSMQAMIQNDEEKAWMQPLVEFRNTWLSTDDRAVRDYRRMDGSMMVHKDRIVKGPYTQKHRENVLRALLAAQQEVRRAAPADVAEMMLISLEELEEIRRIWVVEKHEVEDRLPAIYEEVIGEDYPGQPLENHMGLGRDDLALLDEICRARGDADGIRYELIRNLLHVEAQQKNKLKRAGIFQELASLVEKNSYSSAAEAEQSALTYAERKRALEPQQADDVGVADQLATFELDLQ